ncbi:hypothetical protein [Actinoplanes flavus]|uniref:Uncharacterized protein n=1 Tax=Actinoplanes flavus TaxID=2820290 RepID=A0ABS3UQ68_9ACTN|nr:hypothetical protein [Actinoplanes flavus]MBO3740918.1 hypothetical protein [Actinoplanes flavus]
MYDEWVIASQDCDLAWKALIGSSDFLLELRPAIVDAEVKDWGIRNSKYLLDTKGNCIDNNLPRLQVTPSVVAAGQHLSCLDDESVLRLKTWLGLRYDRPAVPQRYVKLARSISEKVKAKRGRTFADLVRDVLIHFTDEKDSTNPFELVAVLNTKEASPETLENITEWLAEIALGAPAELGIATYFQAVPDSGISLAYIENAFSLDVSNVSWPFKTPGPSGAV